MRKIYPRREKNRAVHVDHEKDKTVHKQDNNGLTILIMFIS